jgi:hypothetical protein
MVSVYIPSFLFQLLITKKLPYIFKDLWRVCLVISYLLAAFMNLSNSLFHNTVGGARSDKTRLTKIYHNAWNLYLHVCLFCLKLY